MTAIDDTTDHALLTVEEAAERLRIGRTLCFALIKGGHLKAVRFPGARLVRVTAAEVEDFVRRSTGVPA